MRTTDDDVRAQLASAGQILELRALTAAASTLIADLELRTRKPHPCSICGLVVREEES